MKYAIICFALLITCTTQAQTWHFGPKFDVNLSGLHGNGVQSKLSTGWQLGGYLEKTFGKHWSLQPELLYTWSRYKKAGDFTTYYVNSGRSAASSTINLAYVSVPLLLRFNLDKTLSFLAGPQYSYLIYEDEDLLKDDRSAFKKSEFSANVGVQANLQSVAFYMRYNKGLNNINDVDDRYEWKSNHFMIGMSVQIK